ncbi:hypothetical protein SPI_05683 [Niveomyces insectorum RCEF 264]|uniref:DUF7728 domain-containing protein n=1 Tax=Niveomyces insectorum RCEF 264 TaxID=1081102 RepID=A0A167TFW9_9HYPO|nr:hypothetical protein SPI_05683 [Niveomyces insectorum RCEF 264]
MLPPKALFAAAALASSTVSALLLPPPIDIAGHTHHIDTADASDRDRPYHDGAAAAAPKLASAFSQHTAVKVACPGCAMSMRVPATHKGDADHGPVNDDHHGKTITMTGVPNHIPLFFSIDQDPERGHDVLLVNFFEIYPDVDVVGRPLHGLQIPDDHVHVPHGAVDAHHHKGDEHHHNDDDNDDNDVLAQVKHRKNRKNRKTHDATSKTKQRHHRHHGKNHGLAVPVPLGYTLHTQTVGRDASNGMEVVALTLQIIEVDNVFVLGIPAVSMRLIRTPEGGLMIAHVDVAATDVAETTPALPSAENNNNGDDRAAALRKQLDACTNVLCRWRAIAAANIRSHGGCGGGGRGGSTSKAAPNTVPHRGHHWEADYHQRHHHHDGDNSGRPLLEHSWTQLLRMFTAHILFPILIGIAGGIFVSLVGMFVGTLLVRFWRLVFRRGRRDNDSSSSSSHALTHGRRHRHHSRRHSMSKEALQEQGGDEEKASLMAADAAAVVAEEQPAADELPPYHDEAPKTDA